MNKRLFFLLIASLLIIPMVNALNVDNETLFSPSDSNVTYRFYTNVSLDNYTINSTTFSINRVPIQILSPTDINVTIMNVANTSYKLLEEIGRAEYFNITTSPNRISPNYTEYRLRSGTNLHLTIYDEENFDKIENCTIELIGDSSYTYTTTNGSLWLSGIESGTYTIRYESDGYNERLYEFIISSDDYINLTLYSLNQSSATNVTTIIYDEGGGGVENALVKMLKYDITTNSYLLVEMARTNSEGKAVFQVEMFEEFYKFMVVYDNDLKKITDPAYIFSTEIEIRVVLAGSVGTRYSNVVDIIADLTFNNATRTFRFTYTDNNNVIHKGCLKVYTLVGADENTYNTSCVLSSTATILMTIPETNGTTYIAKGFVYFDDEYMVASTSWTFFGGESIVEFVGGANLGLILVALVTIAFAFIGLWNPAVMIIMVPIPMFLGSIIGLVTIPIYATAMIQVAAVILSFLISRRS